MKKVIEDVAKKYGLKMIVLFGSVAKNRTKEPLKNSLVNSLVNQFD